MPPIAERRQLNFKVILILLLVFGLLGAGAVTGHQLRTRQATNEALTKGLAAFAKGNWGKACLHLKFYLNKYPDRLDILKQYAEANLLVRPLERANIATAISSYRRLFKELPDDAAVYRRLVKLYYRVGDFNEAIQISQSRLGVAPQDRDAPLWWAKSLIAQRLRADADKVLTEVVKRVPEEVTAYSLLADISLMDEPETPELALQWLDAAVVSNPLSAEARARRGRFYDKILRSPELAGADYEDADFLADQDVPALLLLAQGWIDLKRLDRAESVLMRVWSMRSTLAERYDLDADDLLLSMFDMDAQVARGRNDQQRMVAVADRGLAELAQHVRGRFLETAIELYLTAGRLDKARQAVEEYQRLIRRTAETNTEIADRATILEALINLTEDRAFDVINQLEPMLERSPKNRLVRPFLAQAYDMTGQTQRSLRLLEEQVARWPGDARIISRLVNAYMAQHRWADALRLVRQVEELRLTELEPRLLILKTRAYATAADARMEQDKAMKTMQRLLEEISSIGESNPFVDEIRLLEAFIQTYLGQKDRAIELLNAVLASAEKSENRLLARMQLVELYTRFKEPQKAIQAAEQAIKEHPDHSAPPIALSTLYLSQDRKADARRVLEQAIETLPAGERTKTSYALVRLMLADKERKAARDLLLKLAEERSQDVQPRLVLLTFPEVQNDPSLVDRLVGELQRIEGERGLRWRYERARGWMGGERLKHQPEEIAQLLDACIAGDPSWEAPVVAKGVMYELMGKPTEAEATYRRMFNVNPEAFEVADRLLRLLERQRRYVEAMELVNRLPVNLGDRSRHLVISAVGVGKYDVAIEELKKRIAASPSDAPSRVLLARLTYAQSRDKTEAFRLLDEAEKLSPDMFGALTSRVAILFAAKEFEAADKLLEEQINRVKSGRAKRELFPVLLLRAEFHAAMYYVGQEEYTKAAEKFQMLTSVPGYEASGYAALGRFYDSCGRLADAVKAWDEGLKIDPVNVDIRRRLVNILMISRNPDDRRRGLTILGQLLELLPNDAELLFLRADAYLTEGTAEAIQKARQDLERAIEVDSRAVNAHLRLIEISREWDNTARVRELITRALGANQGNALLRLAQAGMELDAGNLRSAGNLARAALQDHPRSVEAMNLLASLMLREGRIDEAERYNNQALEQDVLSETPRMGRAAILVARGKRTEAIEVLESYRAANPGGTAVRALVMLADLYRFEKQFGKAEELIQQAERSVAPGTSEVLLARLRWLASQRRYEELQKTVYDRPRYRLGESSVLLAAASMLAYSNDPRFLRVSRQLFEEFIKLKPDRVEGYTGLAQVAHGLRDMDAVIAAYQRALELSPNNPQVLNNLAWILSEERGEVDKALTYADKAVLRNPQDVHLLNTRGVILYRKGDDTKAAKDLEKCLELAADLPETRANTLLFLGRVHQRKGEAALARQRWQEALVLDRQHHVLGEKERLEIEQTLKATN